MSLIKRTIHRPDMLAPLRKPAGLGDVVAAAIKPVVIVLDATAGTHLASCGGCKSRKDALNKLAPNPLHQ